MSQILRHLEKILALQKSDAIPYQEMIQRAIKFVEDNNINELELILNALMLNETTELQYRTNFLMTEVNRRRDIFSHIDKVIEDARRQRDALTILRLAKTKDILEKLPSKKRYMSRETLRIGLWGLLMKAFDPKLTIPEITENLGFPIDYEERVQRYMHRVREKLGKEISESV